MRSGGAEGACTRQKEKSKKWRVRSHPCHPGAVLLHTSKRKKEEMTCAERHQRGNLYTSKKKKQEITCAERHQKETCTRQKEKSKK